MCHSKNIQNFHRKFARKNATVTDCMAASNTPATMPGLFLGRLAAGHLRPARPWQAQFSFSAPWIRTK